ncbi:MAG: hypothetical protein JEZ11_17805 [Desulfobacterales bacterium]|nr:hypothetical protein [Desulfobacterales bacterium]
MTNSSPRSKLLWITSLILSLLVYPGILCFTGCQTAQTNVAAEKGGKVYGVTEGAFRHRWWNYYERALSFADGGLWKESEADLMEALKQRKEDQRRARTYGMHFVDYFPHRELGIAYLGLGRIPEAIAELEASLEMEASSKAQLYLDRARKRLVNEQRLDSAAPAVTIDAPLAGALTREFTVTVHGKATDDTYVRSISVGGKPVRIDVSAAAIPFKVDVPVDPGENHIPVVVTDITGKSANAIVTVHVDRVGPGIMVDTEAVASGKGRVRVKGQAFDAIGLSRVFINDVDVGCVGETECDLDLAISPASGQTQVIVIALDTAGNRTEAAIPLKTEVAPARTGKSRDDGQPPEIRLRDAARARITYLDQALIEGSVRDDGGIGALTINGAPVPRASGKRFYFSRLVGLEKGDNLIPVTCTDAAGNQAKINVEIRRDVLKVHEIESRLRVAANPFKRQFIGKDQKLSFGLEDLFISAMIKTGRFSVIDRQEMKKLLEELRLSQTGLIDEDQALEAGKMMAADGMIFGSVLERENSVEIYLRVLDTETAEAIAAADIYGEDVDVERLRSLGRGLDIKLADALPVVEGIVVQADGDKIVVDLGSNQHVRKGQKIIVFKIGKAILHPVTGKVLGSGLDELGQGRIQSVMSDMSFAEPIGKRKGAIQPKYRVITR